MEGEADSDIYCPDILVADPAIIYKNSLKITDYHYLLLG
jgi:hypothetical protein